MTAEHYHALYRWFDAHPAARRFVVALDRWLPLVPFVCYPVLLCLLNVRLVQLFLTRQSAAPDLMSEIARSILVPGITFWVGTALRARLDRPRPYDQPGFTPLVQKDTHGRSFPSRHALSAAVLAMVWLYFLPGCRLVHDRHRPAHCRGAGAHRRAPYPGCGRRACPRVCLRLCRHVAAVTAPHKNPKLFSNCS